MPRAQSWRQGNCAKISGDGQVKNPRPLEPDAGVGDRNSRFSRAHRANSKSLILEGKANGGPSGIRKELAREGYYISIGDFLDRAVNKRP
jgi:hypothetical protein